MRLTVRAGNQEFTRQAPLWVVGLVRLIAWAVLPLRPESGEITVQLREGGAR